MQQYITKEPEIVKYILHDDDQFPNSGLFLLIYKGALLLPEKNAAGIIEEIFRNNGWENSWQNGIYDYHHYHSITHEVLGINEGSASVQFGGPQGVTENISKGDVIIIPAGVAHKCIGSSDDFECIGAYPEGKDYDIKKGDRGERPEADENIKQVPLPEQDPVYGTSGALILNWEIQ